MQTPGYLDAFSTILSARLGKIAFWYRQAFDAFGPRQLLARGAARSGATPEINTVCWGESGAMRLRGQWFLGEEFDHLLLQQKGDGFYNHFLMPIFLNRWKLCFNLR